MPTPINRLFRRLSQRRSKKSGNIEKQNIAAGQMSTESAKRFSNGLSQSSSPPLLRTDSKIVHKGSWCCAPNCSSSLASSNNDSAGQSYFFWKWSEVKNKFMTFVIFRSESLSHLVIKCTNKFIWDPGDDDHINQINDLFRKITFWTHNMARNATRKPFLLFSHNLLTIFLVQY